MPRPQRELDPNGGLLVEFARDLRALREQAGSPKFATMARRVGRSKSTLAEAAGGQHLPRWDTVADFVRACEADPAPWLARWEQLRRELGTPTVATDDRSTPLPDGEPEPSDAPPVPEEAAPEPPTTPAVVQVHADGAETEPDGPTGGAGEHGVVVRRWSGRSVLVAAAVAAVVFGAAGVVIGRASGPEVAGPSVRAVEVQNKVALGANLLVEDRTPSYLSTMPISYCAATDRHCKVAGTEMMSGSGVVAHCVTHGQQMHNYNVGEVAAASNPDRSTSDLWYRAAFPDGRSGFISEVYLTAGSRGGLGLPDCGPDAARDTSRDVATVRGPG